LRTKVLIEINEDFHQADKVNEALKTNILVELVRGCQDHDDTIRELASRALVSIGNTAWGREILVEKKLLPHLSALFEDKVVKIRSNAYTALINLAEFTFGIQSIIDTDILRILVDKLVDEKEETILVLILRLIHSLLEGEMATDLVLSTPVLVRLNNHLKSKNWQIRRFSAENLGSISYNVMGKTATIEACSIPPLCEMLSDEIFEVRASALRALASLAQLKEGKIQIYDLDKLNTIIELLFDLDE
jgi:HEAT repeat protein